jgi:arsenate reductase-like glutaredoxin family protein
LRERGIEVDEVNYAKSKLDAEAVRAIVRAAGSPASVINRRHALVKERGWDQRAPSLDELVEAAASDPNVLRRPILIRGKTVLVGFDKSNRAAWEALAK